MSPPPLPAVSPIYLLSHSQGDVFCPPFLSSTRVGSPSFNLLHAQLTHDLSS